MLVDVTTTVAATRFEASVDHLCRSRLDAQDLLRELVGRLREFVPHHGILLLRTDPTTVLPTGGVVRELPPALCKPFWDNELLDDDHNKFVELARGDVPAATLHEATGGELARSRRYRTLYQPLDVTDELRAALCTSDGYCWGIAQLTRVGGDVFDVRDRDLLAAVSRPIATALRARFAVAEPSGSPARGLALVVLNKAGEIESITAEAREWLAELADGSATGMTPVPEPVYAVAGRARAARRGRDGAPACAQVRTARRGWVHLHASCLDDPAVADGGAVRGGSAVPDAGSGAVAVVMMPAEASELMPVLALAYRLTGREQEVLRHLARGLSTAELADRLGITAHTVRDHIKALFSKVGAHTRAELLARIFAEHYFDRLEADVDRMDEGPA
jgi:DNA-binding CsgD family transcriptional regulator